MPLDYQNGKIYKLYIEGFDKIYIGSTAETKLSRRVAHHRAGYKLWKEGKFHYTSSFELFQLVENNPDKFTEVKYCLIEPAPCNNCDELRMKEQEQINKYKHLIINKYNAYTNDEQNKQQLKEYMKQYNKSYIEANKDTLKEQKKQYYEDNKDIIKEKVKQYKEANKDIIKERKKQYYETNKDKLNEKYQCQCGGKYTSACKSRHFKTIKHQKYLSSIINE